MNAKPSGGRGHGHGHGAGGRGPAPGGATEVPPRPVAYRDADKKLRPALFDEEAQAEAQRWKKIAPAQLRRFFGAVTAFVRKADLDAKQTDADAKVSMALLKAAATYAAARDKDRRHQPIQDFFEHHARLVDGLESYRDFARHFEAVVAYHRQFEGADRGR